MEQQKSDQSVSDAQWAGREWKLLSAHPSHLYSYAGNQWHRKGEGNTEAEWLWTADIPVWK